MSVTYLNEDQLTSRMAEILHELGMTEEELEQRAGNYQLDAAQRDLYREYHVLVSLSGN